MKKFAVLLCVSVMILTGCAKDNYNTAIHSTEIVSAKSYYDFSPKVYTAETDSMLLAVSVPEYVKEGESFVCEAEVTNKTDETVFYEQVLWQDENINHTKLPVIIKSGSDVFTDCDTIFHIGLNMNSVSEIKPGESYFQKITFMPARVVSYKEFFQIDGVQFENFKPGIYDGFASFNYKSSEDAEKNDKSISLKFKIEIV